MCHEAGCETVPKESLHLSIGHIEFLPGSRNSGHNFFLHHDPVQGTLLELVRTEEPFAGRCGGKAHYFCMRLATWLTSKCTKGYGIFGRQYELSLSLPMKPLQDHPFDEASVPLCTDVSTWRNYNCHHLIRPLPPYLFDGLLRIR
jgi:hypothetical protein